MIAKVEVGRKESVEMGVARVEVVEVSRLDSRVSRQMMRDETERWGGRGGRAGEAAELLT